MNIPDKFTFFNGKSLLKMTKIGQEYYCTVPDQEAHTAYSAQWYSRDIEHHLHSGKWKIVADLTIAAKEPEMKFPFDFKCKGYESITYTALGINKNGCVEYTWTGYSGEACSIPVEDAKTGIKDGYWIVQSVGEQAHLEKVYEPLPSFEQVWKNLADACKELPEEIVEPVQEYGVGKEDITGKQITTPNSIIKLTSEGIDETTAKMERLAQATENVTMAFESLQSVLDDMGINFGGNINVQTFCCGDE